jgi:hypothetical protein
MVSTIKKLEMKILFYYQVTELKVSGVPTGYLKTLNLKKYNIKRACKFLHEKDFRAKLTQKLVC